MAIELTLDPEEVAMRLAGAAGARNRTAERELGLRLGMTPEDAAAHEFAWEERSYQSLGAIEVFSNMNPRVPTPEIMAHPYRTEHIQRRAEEIRQDRANNAAVNRATLDRVIGRALTDLESAELRTMLEAPVPRSDT